MNKEREVPIRIVYRKKGHGHGHHGGAWKVAFADFMTAMFAMFLVLWLVNQSSDVKSAIAGYFQDPLGRADEFGSSIMPGEGAQASVPRPMTARDVVDLRRDRLQQVADRLEERVREVPGLEGVEDQIAIALTQDGLEIQLLEDSVGVFFDSGDALPNARGETLLALLGQELGELPNSVRIEGHTDARPYRRADGYSNWELSTDRANAARRILARGGLDERQVHQIRGLADRSLRYPARPLAPENRRITITVLFGTEMEMTPPNSAPPVPRVDPPAAHERTL